MYTLFLVACVGLRACEYLTLPLEAKTEIACGHQAAIIAGMVRARHENAGRDLTFEFTCTPTPERPRVQTAAAP